MQEFYQEIIQVLKEKKLKGIAFDRKKIELCRKYGLKKIPTNIQILLNVSKEDQKQVSLLTKPVRTISGIASVAVMTAPFACPHGKCTFCPGGPNSYYGSVPQSYTGREPATMRGIRNDYDSYLQVFNRLEQYIATGHVPDKVEIIVMGGTFLSYDLKYQEDFVKFCFKAMNDFSEVFFPEGELDLEKYKVFFEFPGELMDEERSASVKKKILALKKDCFLEQEQLKNETSKVRCVGLTIETKPDWGRLNEGNRMLRFGCTRVELGIQSVYDYQLKITNRGHDVKDSIESIRILKDLGFKINAHYMPGLPEMTYEKDLEGMKQLFSDSDYRPDMLKIYPCMVAPGTPLYEQYKQGKFVPLSTDDAAKLLAEFKPLIPTYCRVQRVLRDVPTKQWAAGVGLTNFRQLIHEKYKPKCRCIRCREPMKKEVNYDKVELLVQDYDASEGKEFFISFEDVENDLILGFCRLRFPSQCLRDEITKDSAIIRELHVYGSATAIGGEGRIQHKGLGKQLVKKAEDIARINGKNNMLVISGVGVREYYKKLGYEREGVYMMKNLKS